ncbi:MAG: FAD:protein FMN transferase [Verrucomicrobiae bacterium]|nr:FAD:protein FMN transferase [Verrucomicrobiae bacterium]
MQKGQHCDGKAYLQGRVSEMIHRFTHGAMATQFAFYVEHDDARFARQLCEEAFRQIDRLETELSRFNPSSDIAAIGRLKPGEALVLTLDAFECLKLAQFIAADTNGAFDATVGPLLACWRSPLGEPRTPSAAELGAARARTGWQLLMMDEVRHIVGVRAEGVQVDLGGIGKGYALDYAAGLFEEWGVTHALLSAESTVLALDPPEGSDGWRVNADKPVLLRQRALSGSGTAVKGAHILDPRTGYPVQERDQVWAFAPGAAWADALSTAFFVMSAAEIENYCRQHPEVSAIVCGRQKQYFNTGEQAS